MNVKYFVMNVAKKQQSSILTFVNCQNATEAKDDFR
jgi:hypothetical protein